LTTALSRKSPGVLDLALQQELLVFGVEEDSDLVDQARRAWTTAGDVINTLGLPDLRAALRKRPT
jgi:hypothetical protein